MTIKVTKAEINNICQQIEDSQIQNVKSFVMFVGHAHSGHSLIGALLDSHPQSAISNHVNVPRLLLDHELTKEELFKIILFYSLKNNDEEGWINTGYNYQTPSGYQGNVTHPLVLGDKQGGASTRVIMNNPGVVNMLQKTLGDQLKVIFVHRNVFDNIAAFSHYMKEDLSVKHIDRYFENLETTLKLRTITEKNNWFQLAHEDFIKSPLKKIRMLFDFLDLKYTNGDIEKMVAIVNGKPNERRKQIPWKEEHIEQINKKMQEYSI